jgi:aldehyde dehydrogenase
MGGAGQGPLFRQHHPDHRRAFCEMPRSTAADIELALDAAHKPPRTPGARPRWPSARNILNKIADRMEPTSSCSRNVETWDNGKPIRETMAADMPLAIDHFRYFAGCIRAQEGGISEIDDDTVAYHFHEPLGVVGQIIPWNFPILMACGSWRRRWPPATAWCSSRPSRPRSASSC